MGLFLFLLLLPFSLPQLATDVHGDIKWIKEETLEAILTKAPSASRISCRMLELHPVALNLKITPVFEDESNSGTADNILLAFLRAVGVTLTNLDVPFTLKALILKVRERGRGDGLELEQRQVTSALIPALAVLCRTCSVRKRSWSRRLQRTMSMLASCRRTRYGRVTRIMICVY